MTVPNDDGFVGASVTEDQFKQNLVQLLDHIRSLTSGFDLKNGKVYDFASILDFEAIKTKIPAGSIIVIEWGEEYGAYVWDGTNLTKSPYDPLAQAKADATAKAEAAKNDAITAAATDATTKANAAETNAKQAAENIDVKLLLSIQQIVDAIAQFRNDYDSEIPVLTSSVNANAQSTNTDLTRILLSIQQIIQIISENRDEIDSITSSISKTTSVNENSTSHLFNAIQGVVAALNDFLTDADRYFDESEKLKRNFIDQQLYMELMKLQNFDPDNTGSNKYIESQGVVFLPIPSNVIRIDIEAEGTLPTAKGTVLRTTTSINVDGQIVKNHSTLEVQGSSSAGFPKKNWTIALFSDADRTNSILIKLGHMMPHDELVWKANLVDNTHSRNLAVNRLWDQMVLARSGFPKREVDFVNMPGGVGLSYAPTGALGHVDGFQAVVYINGAFYGIGSLNIGKKRGNYNLKSNDQKHIQLEPQGGVNYTAMPTSPTNADSALEIRRPSSWGLEAQAYYERLVSWMAKSRQDMEADGIDNFFNRKNLIDYIILVQVCDLWDHMGKNAELTTWNGLEWYFLPYDCDTVFGLYWTGTIINPDTGAPWRPPEGLLINQNGTAGPVGFFSKCRRIYGTDIDARYAFLRNQRIIDVDNITNICADLLRKFPTELLIAEDQKWNVGAPSTYGGLVQSSSISQIHDWLSIRIPLVDAYFNYTA